MFSSNLGDIRTQIERSIRTISDGYIAQHYRSIAEHYVDKHGKFQIPPSVAEELTKKDTFCYWVADNGTAIDENFPVVIDFSKNLEQVQTAIGSIDLMSEFIQLCVDDFIESEIHFPFKDMVLHIDAIEYPDGTQLRDVIIRVREVTENYQVAEGEDVSTILEIWMAHKAYNQDGPRSEWVYALSARPTIMELDNQSKLGARTQLEWNEGARDYMYVSWATEEQKKLLNNYGKTAKMGIVAMFHYLYKHQKITYREVEAPAGLQRSRRKKKHKPYNQYYVSKLGDRTNTVYTESKPTDKPRAGTAMHIRRGHWQLWPNHRKLPPKLQKRSWVPSTVVGDPRYGIIIRDYNADLVSKQTRDILHEAAHENEDGDNSVHGVADSPDTNAT